MLLTRNGDDDGVGSSVVGVVVVCRFGCGHKDIFHVLAFFTVLKPSQATHNNGFVSEQCKDGRQNSKVTGGNVRNAKKQVVINLQSSPNDFLAKR